jgi:polyvinyl alcohol dehydrogenase (cytochrome)
MRHLSLIAVVLGPLVLVLGTGPAYRAGDGPPLPVTVSTDPNDWPMYNRDVIGTRHNPAEKSLDRKNVGGLVEKWRFPPKGSLEFIGVVHSTVVVNGHVYFGTEIGPAFYKLSPDGKVKWVYRNPNPAKPAGAGLPTSGFLSAALVTNDTVYVGDLGGTLFALDRANGKERWKVDTREKPFPGAHSSNCIFASPILADGKVIVAGGGYEHGIGADPKHKCCTGRGFVAAFEPHTGKVLWKYDVGPEPQKLDPPVVIKDARGEHVFHFGPSTSSVWCTPSYDADSQTLFFGTDAHNSPRQPTKDDPRRHTEHSCAVIAVDARTGAEKWVRQINPDDVWNYALPAYDPDIGRYKDQSIGDTPKIYSIEVNGKPTKVVGFGCKNGGFYVLDAATGKLLHNTPVYVGAPVPKPEKVDPRTLALPSAIGGLQTGCATDGKAIYTNGIDMLGLGTAANPRDRLVQPTGGRVASISLDTKRENWRHERPKIKAMGGTKDKPAFTDVGDPVGSGIALANGVVYFTTAASNKLVALDTSNGTVLKVIDLGPVWCGPAVSRGRVYVGTGNLLFSPGDAREAFFPKAFTGAVLSFGLPGEDEVSRMGGGDE